MEAPKQHVITEFSFDIVQSAGGMYQRTRITGFVGFASQSRF